MDDFPLLAIPFFILAGAIMAEGGMAARIINLAKVFVGFIRGGLALVNILASTLFGCISGSSVADTASIGSVMIPQMIKEGYPRLFAVNVTISGSLQPLLLPPSHNAVIYSLAAGGTVSVAHLFMAGVIPGLLLGLSLMILCLIIAHRKKFPKGETIRPRQALRIGVEAIWGLVTVAIILGGIWRHFHAYGIRRGRIGLCVHYHDVRLSRLQMERGAADAGSVVRTVGIVMIMIGFSIAFGYLMALLRVPALATEFFVSISNNKYVFLLYVNILLLFLGTFMDLAPMLLICTPIFLPVIKQFGIDPVHFGIVMILNLANWFADTAGRADDGGRLAIGRVSMEAVSRSILIFYVPMIIVLLLVTYIPALTLWLPGVVLK